MEDDAETDAMNKGAYHDLLEALECRETNSQSLAAQRQKIIKELADNMKQLAPNDLAQAEDYFFRAYFVNSFLKPDDEEHKLLGQIKGKCMLAKPPGISKFYYHNDARNHHLSAFMNGLSPDNSYLPESTGNELGDLIYNLETKLLVGRFVEKFKDHGLTIHSFTDEKTKLRGVKMGSLAESQGKNTTH